MFTFFTSKADCKIVNMALGYRDLLIKLGVEKDCSAFMRHDFVSGFTYFNLLKPTGYVMHQQV